MSKFYNKLSVILTIALFIIPLAYAALFPGVTFYGLFLAIALPTMIVGVMNRYSREGRAALISSAIVFLFLFFTVFVQPYFLRINKANVIEIHEDDIKIPLPEK
jgi:hypothetical protein